MKDNEVINARITELKGTRDPYSDQALADRKKEREDAIKRQDAGPLKKNPGDDFSVNKMKLEPHLADLATKLAKDFESPLKRFAQDLSDLDAVRAAGAITDDTYALAYSDKLNGLGDAAGIGPPQLAQGIEIGSQQLATMVANSGIGGGPKTVEGLLEAIRRNSDQQLTAARQTAANTGNRPPIMSIPE